MRILADSRRDKPPKWRKRPQILDSTTITLFSNLLLKGVGRHPYDREKERRHQDPCLHSCQRERTLRHKFHFANHKRLFYAQTFEPW